MVIGVSFRLTIHQGFFLGRFRLSGRVRRSIIYRPHELDAGIIDLAQRRDVLSHGGPGIKARAMLHEAHHLIDD